MANVVEVASTPMLTRPVQEQALYPATFEQIDKAIFVRWSTT